MAANSRAANQEQGKVFQTTLDFAYKLKNFHPSLPVKVVTHGFSDGATEFVPYIQAYLNRYNRAVESL